MFKGLRYAKINSVNPLYFIINKIIGNFEEIKGNKYLVLVPTNESKNTLKKYGELWNKIKQNDITSITINLNDYNEKYKKIKFLLKKMLQLGNMIIVVKAVLSCDV